MQNIKLSETPSITMIQDIKLLGKKRKILITLSIFLCLSTSCSTPVNQISMDQYYSALNRKINGKKIIYKPEYDNISLLNKNSLSGLKLNENASLPKEIEFKGDYKSNFLLGRRILKNEKNKIIAIALYVNDSNESKQVIQKETTPSAAPYNDQGKIESYYAFMGEYGNPVVSVKGKYTVFWTGNAYLMIGSYQENDYFIALISKDEAIIKK